MSDELIAQMNEYSTDGDGFSQSDAFKALGAIGQIPTKLDITSFWVKKGNPEKMTAEELLELNELLGDPEKAFTAALKVFDKDDNNVISKDELIEILKTVNPDADVDEDLPFVEQTIDLILQSTIKDGESMDEIKQREDGFIKIDELVNYMMRDSIGALSHITRPGDDD